MRLRHYLGLDGEPITLDGCGCDMDDPCDDARCQMERDLDMRAAFAEFNRDRRRNPPVPEMGDYERALRLREHPWEGDIDLAVDLARESR